MENLPKGLHQTDRQQYLGLTLAGSQNYESQHLKGTAIFEGERAPRGFAADDFTVFATMIFAYKDNKDYFQFIRDSGKPVRSIGLGPGPSLYPEIAELPYVDESISFDLAPANVERIQAITEGRTPLEPHWQAWLEVGEMLYDIGSAENLIALDEDRPDLYDDLRHWSTLSDAEKEGVNEQLYDYIGDARPTDNPYKEINLHEELMRKLRPLQGDVIDDVQPLESFAGTAHIVRRVFFGESIDDTLEVVSHAENNAIQFAAPNALSVSAHISETNGYKGFFTPEELAREDKELVEFPATAMVFETMLGELVDLSDAYKPLWKRLEHAPDSRKMVRPESDYGNAVVLVGRVNYTNPDGSLKYNNGQELADAIAPNLQKVTTLLGKTLYCHESEADIYADPVAMSDKLSPAPTLPDSGTIYTINP